MIFLGDCLYYLVAAPFLVLLLIILLAATNKEVGIRKIYVNTLLSIFHYGKATLHQKAQAANQNAPSYNNPVIARRLKRALSEQRDNGVEYQLHDMFGFLKEGVEAIIQDEVTSCFDAADLPAWNLLTRTNQNYTYISLRVTVLWAIGFLIRYLILFPFRFCLFAFGIFYLFVTTALVGCIPDGPLKRRVYDFCSLTSFRMLARCFSAIITFHNQPNCAKSGGICVANHTSPIDVVILSCDNSYAMVGQRQGGFLGTMQQVLNQATRHVWFERSEARDRLAVVRRLEQHVHSAHSLPILIFPEGTCINNTSVLMFKKGSFELNTTIYPVAIKYNPIFGDPFWNSSKQTMLQHVFMMMTSWAIVCDVWYLPPTVKRDDEDAVQFARRVKVDICNQGGLVDLEWDGLLKREKPKPSMRIAKQKDFSSLIQRRIEGTPNVLHQEQAKSSSSALPTEKNLHD